MALYTVMIPFEAGSDAEAFMVGENIYGAACVIGYEGDLHGQYVVSENIVTDEQIDEADTMEEAADAQGVDWAREMRVSLPDAN